MKINRITLYNFRQYYGRNAIELPVDKRKKIIVIGGKNGYGKTNFLLSLVWCLYGEDISRVDEGFKREIQKEGNYAKFLKSSLNWQAAAEGTNRFSVEIEIEGVELPDTLDRQKGAHCQCKLIREFDVASGDDTFDLFIEGYEGVLFNSREDKINFVNDYLIPVEAAKFVFFDAEKIASWAELSIREEGNVLNDALGKILGLDIYDNLINELEVYCDGQTRESATEQIREQIVTAENGIRVNSEKIMKLEQEFQEKISQVEALKNTIVACDTFLARYSNQRFNKSSLEELYRERKELKEKERKLEDRFNELGEILPYAIAGDALKDAVRQLDKQDQYLLLKEKRNKLLEQNNDFIELLFNRPPFPDNDISFVSKGFYAEKARKIIEELFIPMEDGPAPEFIQDITPSGSDLMRAIFEEVQKLSGETVEQLFESRHRVQEELAETERMIKKLEGDLEDEEVVKYTARRTDAERRIARLSEEKGRVMAEKAALLKNNDKLGDLVHINMAKVTVSKQKKKKQDKARQYRNALLEFVEQQKKAKCSELENVLYAEMKKLMHKLRYSQDSDFIASVKVEILPGNDGLKVWLYDGRGQIRQKESLSQGEKQLYISSLIKAILSLSIQELPIFIDTPLGRLDDEHIKNVLLYYYPDLAEQVVLFATDNEIPRSKLDLVQGNVSCTYLLDCNNNRTRFKPGYF